SVNYNEGEARYANVRGTEPRLNSVMLDGERIPSADAETRAVQLDLIPADMVQTIEVNKTVTSDMDADAIGGSINLITRQAPNSQRFTLTLGSGYNFLAEKPMLNGSFVIGRRAMKEKFGMVISGTLNDHRLGSDNVEGTWRITRDGDLYPKEWEIRTYQIRRLRRSISAAFDFQINEYNKLFFNSQYNHRDDWENRFRLQYLLQDPDKNGVSQQTEIRRQTKAGLNNDRFDNARLEDQRSTLASLKGKHIFADFLEMKWSISYAEARETRPHERYLEWQVEKIPVKVDLSSLRTPSFYEHAPADAFFFRDLSEEFKSTREVDSRTGFDFSLPLIQGGKYKNSLSFGGAFKSKDKKRENRYERIIPVGVDSSHSLLMVQTPLIDATKSDFLAGAYQAGLYTKPDFIGGLNFDDGSRFERKDIPSQYASLNYTVDEGISAAYVLLEQNLGKKLKMKAGVRIEQTKVKNHGHQYNENDHIVTPQTGTATYKNILPGLQFKYDWDDNTILRFAYSNTLARPNFYSMVPYREINKNDEELTEGNPGLLPTTSMNLDCSAEKYLAAIGLLSAGLFYKDITNFIYVFNANDYRDPVSGNTYDEYFQPRNGAKANLIGLETSFQRQLTFLPGILSNLSIYLNYTHTTSRTENPEFGDRQISLPGSSADILNINVYWQSKKINCGISFNYTSPYIDPDEVDLTPGLERYYDQVTYLDINGSYVMHPNLRFYLEVNNLLNQPLRYYAGISERTLQQEYYNIRLTAGIKYDLQ
ncbi:MAG: TonB-dependent receptor, partial [Calditrichaeota bacterium]